ncbi:MAG TPA: type II secretion system protein [Chthoniobacterales bacterium]
MKKTAGYTLIEVLVVTAILALIIAGTAAMALVVATQDESNARVARAINYQEQAARLFQLGIDTSMIDPTNTPTLLPHESCVSSLTFSTPVTNTITGVGNVVKTTCTMVYWPNPAHDMNASWASGVWSAGDRNAQRTRVIDVYRPADL